MPSEGIKSDTGVDKWSSPHLAKFFCNVSLIIEGNKKYKFVATGLFSAAHLCDTTWFGLPARKVVMQIYLKKNRPVPYNE